MSDHKPVALKRALSVFETVSIAVSDISPTTGVFLMVPAILAMAGTGSFVVTLVAGIIALCVALTMAELGSMFPVAGGIYSIIRNVLGKTVGFIALICYLAQGIFIPATIALGSASYVVNIFPSLNVNVVGLAIMLIAIGVAILNIAASAKFTALLLCIELLVVSILAIASFLHPSQPISVIFDMKKLGDGDSLVGVGPSVIFTAVTIMLLSFNGFDSAINFSEETSGSAKNVGKSVFRAASTGILAQIIPLIAILIAAPHITDLLKSKAPISYIGESVLGGSADMIFNLGAAIAMFACTIAVLMQFARVLFTSGRDRVWPEAINKAFATLHPKLQTPWVAAVVLGLIGACFVFWSNLSSLLSFTSVLVVVLYALVAISSFVVRIRMKQTERPYRIPLWPLPPAIALIGSIAALTQQTGKDLITVGCIIVASVLYYLVYLKKKEGRIEPVKNKMTVNL
jgi:amino acid transporter